MRAIGPPEGAGGRSTLLAVLVAVVVAVGLLGLAPAAGLSHTGGHDVSSASPFGVVGATPQRAAVRQPTARCSVSATTVAPGESVTLDASASAEATAYRYDKVGDGTFGEYLDRAVLDVTYDEPGTYEPRVQVRSPDDTTDTASCGTVTVEADNEPPSAVFTYSPPVPTAGEPATFDSDSTDEDGEVVAHEWTVDGEPVGDGATLEYAFPGPGEYTLGLTVTDDDGATDSDTVTVTVEEANDPPSVEIPDPPTEPAPGETVTFDAAASDPDGEVVAYQWTVDGEPVGDGAALEYAYPGPGEYTVAVTVTDDDGATATAERTVTVASENQPPTVEIDYAPQEPAVDQTVVFEALAADEDGDITEIQWRVDGEAVDGSDALGYAFPGPGEYTVTVTVTDDDGATATAERTVTVTGENEPPAVEISYSPTEPAPDEAVTFDADATDPDGEVVASEWTVDGEVVGNGPTIEYAYPGPGEYTVGVTVTDDDGATTTAERTVTVAGENEPPSVEISYSPSEPAPDERVVFEADATDPDGSVESYEWTVDGEPVGDGPALEYAYPGPGEYTVGVTVTDDDGATATAERTVTVESSEQTTTQAPSGDVQLTAEWWLTPTEPQAGEVATLVADGPADPRVTYRWQVNGGETTLTGQVVDYAFPGPGEYTVTLEAVGPDETRTQSETVSVFERRSGEGGDGGLAFGLTPANPLPGETVTLVADPVGPDAQYRWDLDGDGEPDERGRVVRHTFPNGTDVTVTLETVDENGQTERSSASVSADGEPVSQEQRRRGLSVSVLPSNPNPGESVTLVAEADVPADEVEAYRWDLDGDGETDQTGEVVDYAFPENGQVAVSLTVVGPDGTTTVGKPVAVGNATLPDTTETDQGTSGESTSGTTAGEDTTTATDEGETTDSDGGGGPGLGVVAALVAVLAVVALLARRAGR